MILKQLYENKKMTLEEKIKIIIKKSVYRIYTHRCWRLPQEWINKYTKYEDLIFYKTEKELRKKINKNFWSRAQEYEAQFWKSYGW